MEDVEDLLHRHGQEIAVVLLSGVNFLTGQVLDMSRLTTAAQAQGAIVGLDLAHAAGNIPLELHDWGVDFAVWCSYKYLNAGPGAVAGCFVHQKHGERLSLPRLAGWWGNDPATRFRMQLEPEFVPRSGASGWQLSNPPILSLAPLAASLEVFREAGLPALRQKSLRLTGYLLDLLDRLPPGRCEVITPREPAGRGAQVSLALPGARQGTARHARVGRRAVRLPRAEHHSRRADAAVQHVSRGLAFRAGVSHCAENSLNSLPWPPVSPTVPAVVTDQSSTVPSTLPFSDRLS